MNTTTEFVPPPLPSSLYLELNLKLPHELGNDGWEGTRNALKYLSRLRYRMNEYDDKGMTIVWFHWAKSGFQYLTPGVLGVLQELVIRHLPNFTVDFRPRLPMILHRQRRAFTAINDKFRPAFRHHNTRRKSCQFRK